MNRLRRYFISGLATILPVGFTVFVFWFLVSRLGSIFQPLLRHGFLARLPDWLLTLSGFGLVLLLILAVGALASGLAGRWFLSRIDTLLRRLPFVRSIYGSAREMTEAVFVKRSSLRRTVLAEYPRPGIYAVGFLTSDEQFELRNGKKAVFVFFPTAPNPTSGWLALVPIEDILETDLSIDEGLRLVVSGGVIRPENMNLARGGRKVKEERNKE